MLDAVMFVSMHASCATAQMICSGYILEKISGREEHCKLTYVQQVGGTALKYLVHDLTGCSKLTLRLGLSLCKFLQT